MPPILSGSTRLGRSLRAVASQGRPFFPPSLAGMGPGGGWNSPTKVKGRIAPFTSPALLYASAAIVLCGCQSSPRPIPTNPSAPLAILETLPPGEPVQAQDLYPLQPGQWTYQHVENDEASELVTWTITTTDRFDSIVTLAKGKDRAEFWAASDQGDIVMPATIEHARNALTLFDPPLLIAPASLAAGEPCHSECNMKVVDSKHPDRGRESGKATRVLEYVDDQRIVTPRGEFRAKRVVVTFNADLRFADATKTGTYWVVPHTGVVAQEHSEDIRILGLLGESHYSRLALVESTLGD